MIPFRPNVSISIPKQRALLAWNGEEESLLLSTDVCASEPTQVLEVVPLPAEPEIEDGEPAVFERTWDLIGDKMKHFEAIVTKPGRLEGEPAEQWTGLVSSHEQIEVRDIRTAHFAQGEEFVTWVEDYLHTQSVDNPSLPEGMREIVGQCIAAGFGWFVFDVVSLAREPKMRPPIQYRFETQYLYYPLRFTRLAKGVTVIDILAMIPRSMQWGGMPMFTLVELFSQAGHFPLKMSATDLAWISQDMADLLGGEDPKLEMWKLGGTPDYVDQDILVSGGYVFG